MSVRNFALAYAARGWRPFPCKTRSKEPAGWLVPHGVLSALIDSGILRFWFPENSTLNIAIACGGGLVVLDIDPRNGGDDELAALERTHGPLPQTPRVLTGGGGTHYYFVHHGARLKNGAIAGCVGVEIKTDGGYVVAPPSTHPNGQPYTWDLGALPSETPLAELPAWIVALAADRPRGPGLASTGTDAAVSVLGEIFDAMGWLGDVLPDGRRCVRCPWVHEHSDGRGDGRDTSTILFPRAEGAVLGVFRCSHSHCSGRTWKDVLDLVPPGVKNAASLALAEKLRAA